MKRGMFGIDLLLIIIVLFAMVISVWVSSLVLTGFNTSLNASGQTEAAAIVSKGSADMSAFDFGIPLIFIVGGIITIAMSFRLQAHPIYFVVSLIMIIIGMMFSGILAVVFNTMASGSFSTPANTFTLSSSLFTNIYVIFAVIAVISAVILYGRSRDSV